MNIFHRFAAKSLRANRTRTIVTIIGIILSVAMLTAVTTLISSIQAYGIAYETAALGDWHVRVNAVNTQKLLSFEEDERVDRIYEMQNIGYAYLEDGKNSYKPYLCIQAMNEGFAEYMPIHITEGRMPENDTEILIPNHVKENGGVEYHLGDTLELQVGFRESEEGERLWQKDALLTNSGRDVLKVLEHLVDEKEKSYTVVGFYERPDFENYSAPGYTALTMDSGENSSGSYDCYLVMKNPGKAIGFWEEMEGTYDAVCNNSLLRFYGYSVRSDFNAVIYGMGSILIVIIVFGSVALIYNAFAISVSERTKQFGLLASIGATRKQMKKTVCFEAFLLCLIGIPLGILSGICGIGITLSCFADSFEYLIGNEKGITMKLSVSLEAVVIAALVGMITVLISAYLPMRRALKVSAIDAIRQRNDIKLTKKSVRIPKWVEKRFGLEGMIAWKNFKRNKKQYRATIISLALSILLFVSAGSFSDYMFGSYQGAVELSDYDISAEFYSTDYDTIQKNLEIMTETELAELVYQTYASYLSIKAEDGMLSDQAARFYSQMDIRINDSDEEERIDAVIQFLPEDVYHEMLNFYKLDASKYLDTETPKAVVLNSIVDYTKSENQEKIQVLKEDCQSVICVADTLEGVVEQKLEIGDIIDNTPSLEPEFTEKLYNWAGGNYEIHFLYPISAAENILKYPIFAQSARGSFFFTTENSSAVVKEWQEEIKGNVAFYDAAGEEEQFRTMLLMINVFCYGFISLITLISAANVFNTISTNIGLRRREFAMLKSVGMTQNGLWRMMNFECLIYGMKGLGFGFLISIPTVVLMYYLGYGNTLEGFYLPWRYVVISVFCVFAVVYATMLYAQAKVKKENMMEVLKGELQN